MAKAIFVSLKLYDLQETLFSQHLLVCALMEAGDLALQLGTSVHNLVTDTSLNMIDAICTVILNITNILCIYSNNIEKNKLDTFII